MRRLASPSDDPANLPRPVACRALQVQKANHLHVLALGASECLWKLFRSDSPCEILLYPKNPRRVQAKRQYTTLWPGGSVDVAFQNNPVISITRWDRIQNLIIASGEFSSELCEQLFTVPKYTASRIAWKPGPGNKYIFQCQVLTADGQGLELTGYWTKNGRHNRTTWGFSLHYKGHCVRAYDMCKYHKNPGGQGKVRGPHKHKFSSSKIERFAYKPDPPISEDDPNQSLIDFLREANIELRSEYQSFMFS